MVRPALLHAYAGCGQDDTAGSDKQGQGDGEFLAHSFAYLEICLQMLMN